MHFRLIQEFLAIFIINYVEKTRIYQKLFHFDCEFVTVVFINFSEHRRVLEIIFLLKYGRN